MTNEIFPIHRLTFVYAPGTRFGQKLGPFSGRMAARFLKLICRRPKQYYDAFLGVANNRILSIPVLTLWLIDYTGCFVHRSCVCDDLEIGATFGQGFQSRCVGPFALA